MSRTKLPADLLELSMIKIPPMTSGDCRESTASFDHGADRLEPTRPLNARDRCHNPIPQLPILSPGF